MKINLSNLPTPVLDEVLKGALEIDNPLFRALASAMTDESARRSRETALGEVTESIRFEVPFMAPGEAMVNEEMLHQTVTAMAHHRASIRDPVMAHAFEVSAAFLAQIEAALHEQVQQTSKVLAQPAN